jgi:hypothetical protein
MKFRPLVVQILRLCFAIALITAIFGLVAFGPEGSLKLLLLAALAVTALTALVFIFLGEELVNRIGFIKHFRKTQETWSSLQLDSLKISPTTCLLSDLVQWRFEEISDSSTPEATLNVVRHVRFGNVATVVFFRDRPLRHLTRELQVYSAAFLALMLIALFFNLNELLHKSPTEIADAVLSQHFIPILEVFTIIYLIFRFTAELQSMKSLMNRG